MGASTGSAVTGVYGRIGNVTLQDGDILRGDGSLISGIDSGIPGISTTGISVFQDIDVDGHTNLDNVSVTGVGTFGAQINHFGPKISGSGSDNGITLLYNGVVGALTFHDDTSDGFIRSYSELFFLVDADQSTGWIGGGLSLIHI